VDNPGTPEPSVPGPPGEAARSRNASLARPHARPRAVLLLGLVAAGVLLADIGTKQLALHHLADREPVRLLGGAVYLTFTRNSGAAFSLGRDYTFVFPLVAIGVVGWITWMARSLRSLPWGVALGLVLGGALGNLADRVFREPGPFVGHVIDMVSVFDDRGQAFPVFNLADSALTVGVCLAILLELTGRQRDGTRLGKGGKPGDDASAVPVPDDVRNGP
jgi:signal peptidase II